MMPALSPTRAEETVLCSLGCGREAAKVLPMPGADLIFEYDHTEFSSEIVTYVYPQEADYCLHCASIRQEEVTAAREWRGFCRAHFRDWCRRFPSLAASKPFRKRNRELIFAWKPRPLLAAPQDTLAGYHVQQFWLCMEDVSEIRALPFLIDDAPRRAMRKRTLRTFITLARRHRIEAAQLRKVA